MLSCIEDGLGGSQVNQTAGELSRRCGEGMKNWVEVGGQGEGGICGAWFLTIRWGRRDLFLFQPRDRLW